MTELDTTITEVTVYLDRARVTRRGTVELKQGEHRLQVGELPLSLLPESVRAGGKGTAQAHILAVDVAKTFYQEPPTGTVAELEREIEKLEDQHKTLADQAEAHQAQLEFLKGLGAAAGENLSKGIAFGKSKVADGQELLGFVAEGMATASQGLREVTAQRRELEKELTKLRKELEQQRSAQPRVRYAVTVDVEVLDQGEFELEVTYMVRNASWQPLYDLRLGSDQDLRLDEGPREGKPDVTLTYLGQVTQRSGEDWEEGALSLSTAKPALATTLPELRPWYVSVPAPPPPRAVPKARPAPAMLARALTTPSPAAEPAPEMMLAGVAMEEEAAEPVEMEAVTAEVEETGAALTFRVAKPATIPSDGSPPGLPAGHRHQRNRLRLPARPGQCFLWGRIRGHHHPGYHRTGPGAGGRRPRPGVQGLPGGRRAHQGLTGTGGQRSGQEIHGGQASPALRLSDQGAEPAG